MPENIFISYARGDGEDHARQLNTDLKALGHTVWFDKDQDEGIKSGTLWQREIEKGIDKCSVFLLLMTPKSIISTNVEAEWSRALNKKKMIIPLRLIPTDGKLPVEYDQLPLYIAPLQYVDFVTDFADGWGKLTYRLTKLSDTDFQVGQQKAQQTHHRIPIAVRGYLLTDPDNVPRLPDILIGRDALKAQVEGHVTDKGTVVLHGIGGVGKSSLASEVIADQLEDNPQTILWLEVGNAPSDAVFDQIGQVFNQSKAMIDADSDEDKIRLTRDLIKANNIQIIVIDDVWNPSALASLLKAIPKRRNPCAVLITSRQRQSHVTSGTMIPVDSLDPDDAKKLLLHHAGKSIPTDGADELCQLAHYHPFLLEVAGKLLAQRDIPPQRLIDDMADQDITDLTMPDEMAEDGRENMAKLMQQSLNILPDDFIRTVFLAFGHLPTSTATPELLALLLSDDIATMNSYFFEHLSDEKPAPLHNLPDLGKIQKALDHLVKQGLLQRVHAQARDGYPYMVEHFQLHDLSHSYATAQASDPKLMVTACLVYTWRHNAPAHDHSAALRTELENLMLASSTAMTQKRWQIAEYFAWNLHVLGGSRFTNSQGYYSDAITLLTQAAKAAKQRGNKQSQAAHLNNLGKAYLNLRQYQKAIENYQKVIELSKEIGDRHEKGNALGNLGIAYRNLGQYQKAIDYHQQYLEVSREIRNRQGEGIALGNLGSAYKNLGQYQKAIDYYEQQVLITNEIGDRRGKGNALRNLGNAYYSLRQYDNAIANYKQYLEISREIGDRKGVANSLYSLGLLRNNLKRFREALPLLEESLELSIDIGLHHITPHIKRQITRAKEGLGMW